MCTEVDGWNNCGVYVGAPSRTRAGVHMYVCMYACVRVYVFAYVHSFAHTHMHLLALVITK